MSNKGIYRDFDKSLLAVVLAIFLIGLIAIHSSTQAKALEFKESYTLRQISWMVLGLAVLAGVVSVSYQSFIDAAYLIYGINVILLILVLILGRARLGAQRWFSIGAFAFQPSEFMKLSFILALSAHVGRNRDSMEGLKSLFIPLILLLIPFGLVLLQPDLGTALVLVPIFLAIMLIGGLPFRYLIAMLIAGTSLIPLFWHMLHDYQKQRLLVFINPNADPLGAGYTIIQSKIAIGSGGLFGKGWLAGTQNRLNFLPERHTDFIFSVIGEEWGFLGTILLVLLYLFIVNRAFRIASLTSDLFGRMIASGIAVMIGLQVIINIGMTVGLMPVVGIPLPLVSYGGSSLLATLIVTGLLLNIGMRRSTF